MTSPRSRARRRDGIANRELLLDAAEFAIDNEGTEVSLHGIVATVGLGIGTLYRHFPTRTDLIRAVYDRQMDRVTEVFQRCATIDDGWEAMVTCIDGMLELLLEHPRMPAVATYMARVDPDYGPALSWHPIALAIVARGHDQGTIRADATAQDIAHIPSLLAAIGPLPTPAREIVIARMRRILLDGLRSDTSPRVPIPAAPLDPEVLHALAQRRAPHDSRAGKG